MQTPGSFAPFLGYLREEDGLSWRWQLTLFIIIATAVVLRRPDALSNPQFYAEDGTVWFADAYNLGWVHSLLSPSGGYFNTLPRLIASLAQVIPFRFAPLFLNLGGIGLQAMPAFILLSGRCANWGSLPCRALMAVAYVALPNSKEIDVTITNAQFHLALAACLLAFGKPPEGLASKIFDATTMLISGLTGPFCLALLPLVLFCWWQRRQRWSSVTASILAISSVLQIAELLHSATRTNGPLGGNLLQFLRILDGQVYGGALLGRNGLNSRHHYPELVLIAFIGMAFLVYCVLKANLQLRLFVLFGAMLFAASLRHPLINSREPAWEVLRGLWGMRYWFFPMLGFLWSLIWCATEADRRPIRVAAACLLALGLRGSVRDWRYPTYVDRHFSQSAKSFDMATPGSLVIVPIVPVGWELRIAKKPANCKVLSTGFVDAPLTGEKVSGQLLVNGWLTSSERIMRVTLLVDNVWAQAGELNVPRPDVDRIYPGSPNKNQGWIVRVDTSYFEPGKHILHVRTVDQGGCDAEYAQVPFELVR